MKHLHLLDKKNVIKVSLIDYKVGRNLFLTSENRTLFSSAGLQTAISVLICLKPLS